MIKVSTAFHRADDTAFVGFEDISVGFNGDRDGLLSDSSLKLGGTIGLDILEALDADLT